MPPKEHHVVLRLDSREKFLVPIFKKAFPNGHPCVEWTHQLDYGDVQILVDGHLNIIIERKRADDFQSSVIEPEQRFRKQRNKLLLLRRDNPSLVIMYLLEGDLEDLHYGKGTKFTKQYLYDRQEELTTKYGIPVKHVAAVEDSAKYVSRIWDKCRKNGSAAQVIAKLNREKTDAIGVQKFCPDMENSAEIPSNPLIFFRNALVTLNGVTPAKAQLVVDKYHTLEYLQHCYRRIPDEKKRRLLLANLKVPEEKRRFGPVLSTRIYAATLGLDAGSKIRIPKRKAPEPVAEMAHEDTTDE